MMFSVTRTLFGQTLTCTVSKLDTGIHVLLTGGHRSHIGAVSTAEPGNKAETMFYPGHKDQFISAPWAEAIAEATGEPVCVVCGIHYDNATSAQIAAILTETDSMRAEVLAGLDAE